MNSTATEVTKKSVFLAPAKNYVLVIDAEQQVYIPDAHAPGGYNVIKKPGMRIRFENGRYETADPKEIEALLNSEAFGKDIYLVDTDKKLDPKDAKIAALEKELTAAKAAKVEVASTADKPVTEDKTYKSSDGKVFKSLSEMRRHQIKINMGTKKKAKK